MTTICIRVPITDVDDLPIDLNAVTIQQLPDEVPSFLSSLQLCTPLTPCRQTCQYMFRPQTKIHHSQLQRVPFPAPGSDVRSSVWGKLEHQG